MSLGLSKGWGLIERYSKDIGLALDRSLPGYKGDLSKSQIKKLRNDSCTFISEAFKTEIEGKLQEMNIPEVSIQVQDFKDSDSDPFISAPAGIRTVFMRSSSGRNKVLFTV
ncbi:hypothetical protein WJR50_30710 [Catalinimonas sp. 4WD22]|uniref:hypothetical protein n=1 Tax=Catalinimonas locisalis TaxID=3133978 RepID=UPI003100D3CA